jgi:hypothetical protein
MKTSTFRFTATALLALLALPAFAGPGPEYWQARAKLSRTSDKAPATSAFVCPGSKEVPVYAKAAAWANGRGPLVDKQVGTKRVCTVCPVSAIASSGATSASGSVSDATGAQHDCTAACRAAKS